MDLAVNGIAIPAAAVAREAPLFAGLLDDLCRIPEAACNLIMLQLDKAYLPIYQR